MNQKTIKKYSSLANKKYRQKYGLFLVEGYHSVEELLKSEWKIECVITSNEETCQGIEAKWHGYDIELVKPAVINRIADSRTPQDILAVAEIPSSPESNLSLHKRIVIADQIKDPGNMGTIIRTARAFGFGGLATISKSADLFNPKTVRSTQGAMFGMELFCDLNADQIKDSLKPAHTIYALDPQGDVDINNVETHDLWALIIGSEIKGISRSILDLADYRIRIPHSTVVNSLNAAVACGIAMHALCSRR